MEKCGNVLILLLLLFLERVSSEVSSFTMENVSERVKKVSESVKHIGW